MRGAWVGLWRGLSLACYGLALLLLIGPCVLWPLYCVSCAAIVLPWVASVGLRWLARGLEGWAERQTENT